MKRMLDIKELIEKTERELKSVDLIIRMTENLRMIERPTNFDELKQKRAALVVEYIELQLIGIEAQLVANSLAS
jgi:hypothetical protein